MLFKVFNGLCKKSRKWSQIYFVDKLCPPIHDQYDMLFWKHFLPNVQELLIHFHNTSSFYLSFNYEHDLCKYSLLKKLSIADINMSQQKLSLISQRLIHLNDLRLWVNEKNVTIANFPQLQRLKLENSSEVNVYLTNLPKLQNFDYEGTIQLLQIENVQHIKFINGFQAARITKLVLLSSVSNLHSCTLGHGKITIENIHFINMKSIVSLTCSFQQETKQISDYTQNMTLLNLSELDSFVDIPWNQYQKLEKLKLHLQSFKSMQHFFCFSLPVLRKLILMWSHYSIDFAKFSQFPNLQKMFLLSRWDTYINFPCLFELTHLKSAVVIMHLRDDDQQLLEKNIQKCFRRACKKRINILTAKQCSLCKLFLCDKCFQHVCCS